SFSPFFGSWAAASGGPSRPAKRQDTNIARSGRGSLSIIPFLRSHVAILIGNPERQTNSVRTGHVIDKIGRHDLRGATRDAEDRFLAGSVDPAFSSRVAGNGWPSNPRGSRRAGRPALRPVRPRPLRSPRGSSGAGRWWLLR